MYGTVLYYCMQFYLGHTHGFIWDMGVREEGAMTFR